MNEQPLFSLIPFILMLASIAVMPLFASHFWEKNLNKLIIALILAIPTAVWMVLNGMFVELEHTIIYDYVPFIILLGALFVITGGIFVEGDIEARPFVNTLILGIGAVLASFMGTTGAAMLLIRPILKTNSERKFKVHTILFFIGIIANCGGLLTPLGDPPLFMMYLRGASFGWFFSLWPIWLVVNGLLLIIYFFTDMYYYKKESKTAIMWDKASVKPIKVKGLINFVWLGGVVLAVAFINPNTFSFVSATHPSSYLREIVILIMALMSFLFTKSYIRKANLFSWDPILEVTYLFLGIFVTMVPCLLYLEHNAQLLHINVTHKFYYATGALSSFLDNTPTAVTFYYLAMGLVQGNPALLQNTTVVAGIPEMFLAGISAGAVLFGSMTYIGNGPNFMVKAIAESQGIKMPDFFSYMFKFSLIVLLPIFILIQLLFF